MSCPTQYFDESPKWRNVMMQGTKEFEPHEVDVLVAHENSSDAIMAVCVLMFAGYGSTEYRKADHTFKTVFVPAGATKLPDDTPADVFRDKNVLICNVAPGPDIMDDIYGNARNHLTLGHCRSAKKSTRRSVFTDKCSGCALMWAYCHHDTNDGYNGNDGNETNLPAPITVRFIDAAYRYDFTGVRDVFQDTKLTVEDAMAFYYFTKTLNRPCEFAQFLCFKPADLNRWITDGYTLRMADSQIFAPTLDSSIFHDANTPNNCHEVSFFVVRCDDQKIWNSVAAYYFDMTRGSGEAADVFAIIAHSTSQNQVNVDEVKFLLRCDNFAAEPINVYDIAKLYEGGDGLSGAASFTVSKSLYGDAVGTPANGIPMTTAMLNRWRMNSMFIRSAPYK